MKHHTLCQSPLTGSVSSELEREMNEKDRKDATVRIPVRRLCGKRKKGWNSTQHCRRLDKGKKIVYCIQLILSNNNTETIIIYLVLFVGVCCFPACQSVVVTMVVDNLGLLFDANRSVL